jgi:hypothetical protein
LRGWVTAPVTGEYTFWISGDDDCELWLSTGESKFQKRRIAHFAGWTGVQQWDKFPTQRSAAVQLAAGRKYFIEVLHKDGLHADFMHVAWARPGGGSELLPSDVLTPYLFDPEDRDMDELPDTWEEQHGLSTDDNGSIDPRNGPLGDPDRDGFTNLQEFEQGTHPGIWGGLPGHLTREVWHGISGDTISRLVFNPDFYRPPNYSGVVPGAATGSYGDNYGQRLRGWIVPPADGAYTFWVAGDDEVELWLSEDQTPWNRKRICWIQGWTSLDQWERMPSQKSAPVILEAGRRY